MIARPHPGAKGAEMTDLELAINHYETIEAGEAGLHLNDNLTKIRRVVLEALREKTERNAHTANNPLTLDEIRGMELLKWVWIEVLIPYKSSFQKESAYYQIYSDYTQGEALCCGYPGMGYEFDYSEYGQRWTAYRSKPKEIESIKSESTRIKAERDAALECISTIERYLIILEQATDYIKPNTGVWNTVGIALQKIREWRGLKGEANENR